MIGATLIAVEDASGAVFNPKGIDPAELFEYAQSHQGVSGFPAASPVDHETF